MEPTKESKDKDEKKSYSEGFSRGFWTSSIISSSAFIALAKIQSLNDGVNLIIEERNGANVRELSEEEISNYLDKNPHAARLILEALRKRLPSSHSNDQEYPSR